MIDWTRVQDLRAEIGPDDFAAIVALFLDEADAAIRRLPSVTTAKALEHSLHDLKGSALNLGFTELARHCQTAELAAAAGHADLALEPILAMYSQSRLAFLSGLPALAA